MKDCQTNRRKRTAPAGVRPKRGGAAPGINDGLFRKERLEDGPT